MEFIVYSEDKADSLHIRQAAREDHLAWLKTPSEVKLLIAGPWLDDAGVMRGSLLIVEAKDKDSVSQWLARDPCLLYTSPSPRDGLLSRMPSSA